MVTIEPIAFIIRVGEKNFEFLDDYTTVCTGIKTDPDTIRIIGMVGTFTIKQAIIMKKKLKELGFKYVIWERLKDGEYHYVKTDL